MSQNISHNTHQTNQNWAKPLSDYLIYRQSQQFDQSHLINQQNIRQPTSDYDLLFQAMMQLLAVKLAEGHTCFQLTDIHQASDTWQHQLIDAVATPLIDFILAQYQIAMTIDNAKMNTICQPNSVDISTQKKALFDFLMNNAQSHVSLQNPINNKTNNKINNRTDAENRLLAIFNQMLIECDTDTKNVYQQQITMQIQQLPEQAVMNLDEHLTLIYKMIDWLTHFKQMDLSQFANSLGSLSYHLADNYPSFYQINSNQICFPPYAYFVLADELTDALTSSAQNQKNHAKPLVYDMDSSTQSMVFWLHRSWQAERDIAKHVLRISAEPVQSLDMDDIINQPNKLDLNSQQRSAIQITNRSAFSIITGGPGTGKTHTVAALVQALYQYAKNHINHHQLTLSLAAPTGKAAQRMQESLQNSINKSGIDMLLPNAKTVHRLLGIGVDGVARYDENNPLSEDIIIIDEASMLGAELTSQLLAAVKTGSRLILLGDSKQLAAVEAGSVLADLCAIERIAPMQVTLIESRRFDDQSAVGKLALLIHQPVQPIDDTQNNQQIWKQFNDLLINHSENLHYIPTITHAKNNNNNNTAHNFDIMNFIKQNYKAYINHCLQLLSSNNPNNKINVGELFEKFNHFRILTAGHTGFYGDDSLNKHLTRWHRQWRISQKTILIPPNHTVWYHGRPVMIQKNIYSLGLYNGDVGICLYHANRGYEVYFDGQERPFSVSLLDESILSTAYAITVHKSQGSEFNHVALAFDPSSQRLLSRELIYTGITRAKKMVSLLMNKDDFITAIKTPTVRQTGLAWHFDNISEKIN